MDSTPNSPQPAPQAAPRLTDVAKQASVSPATVSRVLNRSGVVNARTRERVMAAIAELGYVHSPSAQSTEKENEPDPATQTIAIFITDILNPIFPEVLRGIEDEISTQPIAMQIHNVPENAPAEKLPRSVLARHKADGVIAFASHIEESDLQAIHAQGLPLVVLNRRVQHPSIPCIVVDFEDAAFRSAQHLIRLQHRRVGFLAGLGSSPTALARKRGIERALASVGENLSSQCVLHSFPSIEGGFQAMSALLALPPPKRPTAVITYNDLLAFGALHAIRAHGLSVPEDISVVGCDGITLAAHSNPPLTTIDQPKYKMGRLAMQLLAKLMQKEADANSGGYTLMESPLLIRGSTGLARENI